MTPKKRKKVWCKHISWRTIPQDQPDFIFGKVESEKNYVFEYDEVHPDWNFCPICGAKRPKE